MRTTHAAINPLLMSTLTGQDLSSISEKPTVSQLPGVLTKLIAKHKKKIEPKFEPNKQFLICGHCGSRRRYDLGLVTYNLKSWRENEGDLDGPSPSASINKFNYMQTTGYFRCKQCNGAGNWQLKSLMFTLELFRGILADLEEGDSRYRVGEMALYDGSTHKWATDAEDYFLKKLGDDDHDGFLWNRLGNMYFSGGRPELAVAAYEKSIGVDPSQLESHYSLSTLLFEVGEFERSAYHSRMMLISARCYPHMPILKLREMLAAGLQELYNIHVESDRKIPFTPTQEELEVMDSFKEVATGVEDKLIFVDLEVFQDDRESFYPLAEMYLGSRKDEIPVNERTLDQYLQGNRKQTPKPIRGHLTSPLGTDSRPIVIKVRSEERAEEIYRLCERYDLHCIIGIEFIEDLSDLRTALMHKLSPSNVYAPCPCGSGLKYKFCCTNKIKSFDLERFIEKYGTRGKEN